VDRRPAAPGIAVRLSLAAAFACGGFVLLGPPLIVSAEVSPGCSAHITDKDGNAVAGVNSQDANTAIPVTVDQVVKLDILGETGTPATVHVDYGLTDRFPFGKDANGTSYAAKVSDYVYMSGLYRVSARTGPNGTCTAAALVSLEGNPLGGPVGDGALVASVIGVGGLAAGTAMAMFGAPGVPDPGAPDPEEEEGDGLTDPTTGKPWTEVQLKILQEIKERDPAEATMWKHATPAERQSIQMADSIFEAGPASWFGCLIPMLLSLVLLPVLLLLRAAMAIAPGAGGDAAMAPVVVAPLHLPRRAWRPVFSFSGVLGGLIGAVGVVVLLQQGGKLFPTTNMLVRALAAGFVVGIALPSLARVAKVRRANRRIAVIEGRANRARVRMAARVDAPTATPGAAYAATHVVSSAGLDAWDAPDPSRAPAGRLDAGLDIQVTERSGDWAHVLCSNGWSAWVDGRGLKELRP
jgi:hypothetical protein